MLTTIKLGGTLGRMFCKEAKLQVSSVAEAIRALSANFPNFKAHIIASELNYKVIVNKNTQVDFCEIPLDRGCLTSIEIIPVTQGSSGAGKIIVGALLIVASFYTGGLAGAAELTAAQGAALSAAVFQVGVSLVIGGIMQLLFKPPEPEYTDPGDTASYNFNGAINTIAQGHPVPIGYGRVIVGSAVISAGIHTQAI